MVPLLLWSINEYQGAALQSFVLLSNVIVLHTCEAKIKDNIVMSELFYFIILFWEMSYIFDNLEGNRHHVFSVPDITLVMYEMREKVDFVIMIQDWNL